MGTLLCAQLYHTPPPPHPPPHPLENIDTSRNFKRGGGSSEICFKKKGGGGGGNHLHGAICSGNKQNLLTKGGSKKPLDMPLSPAPATPLLYAIPSKAASHVLDSQLIIPNLTWANNYVCNEPIMQLYEQQVQNHHACCLSLMSA